MACCALVVWIARLAWRGVRALGQAAARLAGRAPATSDPAAAAPAMARHGQLADG